MNLFKFNKKDIILFYLFFSTSIIYLLPIALSGRYYIDDLGRSIEGYTSWGADGRPLASYIMRGLSLGIPLLDITPFYQIMGGGVLSWVFVLFCKRYFEDKPVYLLVLGYFIFLSSPFLIENLSYRYDSFFMIVSLVFVIFPFTQNYKGWKKVIVCTLCIICSFCCYQSSIGIFAILIILDIVYNILYKKEAFLKAVSKNISNLISLGIGFFIYKKVIADRLVTSGYAYGHSELIKFNKDGFLTLIQNMHFSFNFLEKYIISFPKTIMLLYIVVFVISAIFLAFKIFDRHNSVKSIILLLFLLLTPFLVLLLSVFHICLISHPVLAPRVFTSFCGVLLFISFFILCLWDKNKFSFLLLLPIAYINFLYCLSYSNVSKAQEKMDRLIISSIAYDISHHAGNYTQVSIVGKMPIANELALSSSRFPLMNDLVPIYMNYNWAWGGVVLRHYNINLEISDMTEKDLSETCTVTPFVVSTWYKLYDIKNKVVISFKNDLCNI